MLVFFDLSLDLVVVILGIVVAGIWILVLGSKKETEKTDLSPTARSKALKIFALILFISKPIF